MKLVDILARKLKDWPDSVEALVQGHNGCIYPAGGGIHHLYTERAEDWELAEVTREEWQAAVNAKNSAPQNDEAQNVARTEWDGEGLPPVGMVCEVMGGGLPSTAFDWERCTVLLINEGADGKPQVCTRDFRGDLAIYYPEHDAVYFRQIRTPEQIAADERLHKIRNACSDIAAKVEPWNNDIDCSHAMRAAIEAMIDAGYRKP